MRRRNYSRERQQRLLRYHREREELVLSLGGLCHACGSRDDLEFDHPNGRAYALEKLSRLDRLRRYRREAAEGKVRLLCRGCNARDGGGRRNGAA